MKDKLTDLLRRDENSKRKGILSAAIWMCGVFITVIISQAIPVLYGQNPTTVVVDPLSTGYLICVVLALVIFLPLISFSYYHLLSTDSPLLTKTIRLWWLTNLAFVGLSLLVIMAEVHKQYGTI